MFLILILVLYDLGYRKRFGPKKLHKKKRKNSSSLLNHIKSSYIIFCPELFQYSLCIYIHIYILLIKKYQNILGQKIIQEKLKNLTKFLTYIKSSCIILRGSMFGHSHYIYCLQEESTHSGPRVSKNIGLEVMKHFEPQTSQKKNRQRLWCYTKSSHIIICSKMFQYLQIIYC